MREFLARASAHCFELLMFLELLAYVAALNKFEAAAVYWITELANLFSDFIPTRYNFLIKCILLATHSFNLLSAYDTSQMTPLGCRWHLGAILHFLFISISLSQLRSLL